MPSPEFQRVLDLVKARPENYLELPFELIRRDFERMPLLFPPPGDIELTPGDLGGVPALWFQPRDAEPARTIYYLHGGGYVAGSPRSHVELIAQIARAARATAVAIDYRLAPENPFPAAIDDARDAYLALLDQGLQAGQIAVAGDSAGGGLTLALLARLRDEDIALPAAALLMSPWTDLSLSGPSILDRAALDPMLNPAGLRRMADAYLAGQDAAHPWASPLAASLHMLPPLLVQVGTDEILFDDSRRLVELARGAGVDVQFEVYEGMIHFWQCFASFLTEAEAAIHSIGEFLKDRLP